MRVGCLGDIIFSTSTNKVETLTGLKISNSASYSSHKRHCSNEILEFTGNDASTASFNMTLSTMLGVDVGEELAKLEEYKRTGKILKFTLGKKTIGNYRWIITKYTVTPKHYSKNGEVITADVSISLKEYNK